MFVDQGSRPEKLVNFLITEKPAYFELLTINENLPKVLITKRFNVVPITSLEVKAPANNKCALNILNIYNRFEDGAEKFEIL